MVQIAMIVVFASIVLHDEVHVYADPGFPLWLTAALALGPMLMLALTHHAMAWAAGRAMDRRGSWRAVVLMERSTEMLRWGAVLLNYVNIFLLGWLDAIRRAFGGNPVVIDELLAVAPVLAVIIGGWWSRYPVDRRLHDAILLTNLDQGRPVYPPLSRVGFVILNIRHQLLLSLVPLTCLLAWSEACEKAALWAAHQAEAQEHGRHVAAWAAAAGRVFADPARGPQLLTVMHLVGVAAVLLLLPLAVRVMWDTVALGPGPMRGRLLDLCAAQRVKVRNLLVWRTNGFVINGAVLGVLGFARYILLTDALLDQLPARQVEAVMAHEVGHVRRRHILWLLGVMMATAGAVGVLGELALWLVGWAESESIIAGVTRLLISLLALGAAVLVFGWVSRRFEWQADAFAAQALSETPPAQGETSEGAAAEEPGSISLEAAASMAGALDTVARLNHIPPRRFSFRHGSIHTRIERLGALVGQPSGALPIDRTVRRIKLVSGVFLAGVLALAVWQSVA